MKILVDADACPVNKIIEKVARNRKIEVLLICDTAHEFHSDYCTIVKVEKGRDSVDFMVILKGSKGDIIVTQDYGVAAMALGKGMHVINQNGRLYTNENMDQLLFERHMAKQARQTKRNRKTSNGPHKREKDQDIAFERNFIELLNRLEPLS